MTLFKSLAKAGAAIAFFAAASTAGATTITGTFNAHGYDVVNINVAAGVTIDLAYSGGYGDPMLSLFGSDGSHIVTNDDSNGLYSHITQTLAGGNYSVVVTYCCNMINALPGNTFSSSDGFNVGSYWFGGTGTLAGVQAFMNDYGFAAGADYQFELANAAVGSGDVPEPQSVALFGVALAALGLSKRRQKRA
jgi:hypothetical protein